MQSATSRQTQSCAQAAMHEHRADVIVCGGGISGLSLGAWLARAGVDVRVLDKNPSPGGVIGTVHQDGFIFERGPNTVLDKYPSLGDLIELAEIEEAVLRVPLRTQTRHIWLNGRLQKVPTSPLSAVGSRLLPPAGKLAILREPFVSKNPEDESVAAFVGRRLHPSWVRNLIVPMVSGVWAGDPENLSITHAFPLMKGFELDGGSILRGAMRHLKRKKAAARAAGRKPAGRNLVSFPGGLQDLPEALAAKLGARYRGSLKIDAIENTENVWRVQTRSGEQAETWTGRRLVVAMEADRSAALLGSLDSELAAVLDGFPYNQMVVVGLGIETAGLNLPEGFGFLVPRGEGLRILGAIINSNFLPERAPEGCVALSIFIGGELDRAAFELSDEEILGVVRRDLRQAIGWNGEYRSLMIERWPRAIPQYDLRHGERLRQIEAAEARHPGLHLMGNWRGGVSIGDRVEYTQALSQKMIERLSSDRTAKAGPTRGES